ncbi:MAG: ATP-binding protein [Gemmatimonadota bacterium]|nr:MAG: ATP-binding protein [Gemmatimonadota bacterium]
MTSELNPRFDFDSFKVGAGNELALTAARSVAERPGSVYNPLYIHGSAGLGKTHLLMAIGRYAQQATEAVTVEYVTPDRLAEEFHAVASAGHSDTLRSRLADLDMLLVDDVHLVAARTEIHAELLRLFPEMQAAAKQIVMASLYPPAQIEGLDERVTALLARGLVVEINPPDFETRLAILQARAEGRGCQFEEGVVETVAGFKIGNVRELITLLNRLIALEAVGERSLTPDAAKTLLQGEALAMEERETAAEVPERERPVNEFEDFLSDVSEAVQHQIEAWETRLGEVIERYRGEGFETARLESLMQSSSPGPVEAAIDEFERDVDRLRKLRTSVAAQDPSKAQNGVFLDPDRVAEAQVVADRLASAVEPLPGPSGIWTFETYIETEGNRAANEAAHRVVQQPGGDHNPLVIVGKTGVGKTHLLHAIGNGLLDSAIKPIACMPAMDFHDAVTQAAESGPVDDRLLMFGGVRALLIDDVHLLADKDDARERLANLVRELVGAAKQVVFSLSGIAARPEDFPEAIKALVASPTIVRLAAPDRELRRRLTLRMLEERVGYADPELADYLGDRPADSARAVMGLVQRVLAVAESQGSPPSAAIARELIEGALPRIQRPSAKMRTSGIMISAAGGVKSREKMIWSWPDPADRLIEDLS